MKKSIVMNESISESRLSSFLQNGYNKVAFI